MRPRWGRYHVICVISASSWPHFISRNRQYWREQWSNNRRTKERHLNLLYPITYRISPEIDSASFLSHLTQFLCLWSRWGRNEAEMRLRCATSPRLLLVVIAAIKFKSANFPTELLPEVFRKLVPDQMCQRLCSSATVFNVQPMFFTPNTHPSRERVGGGGYNRGVGVRNKGSRGWGVEWVLGLMDLVCRPHHIVPGKTSFISRNRRYSGTTGQQ